MNIMTGFGGGFGFFFSAMAAIVLIAAWVILAGSRFVQGGIVERPERVPQLYGYTACLIGLIWALSSTVSIVDNVTSLSAPELRESSAFNGFQPSVSSFEAFRTSYDRTRRFDMPGAETQKLDSIPEAELHRRYEAMRADRIAQGIYNAKRSIIVHVLSLILAVALFVFHWRWLKRGSAPAPA